MKRNIICSAAAVFLASALLPAAAQQERIPEALVTTLPEPTEAALKPAPIHPFAAVAGNWTGGGTIDLTGDIHEKLRCRASYSHGKSNNSLVLAIRCASDNYKFELTSNVVERGGQISGQWNETAYKVSGSISGRVSGNRITATAKGDSFNAAITVNTTGNKQSVTITPQSTYITNVQIAMGRAAPATTAAR